MGYGMHPAMGYGTHPHPGMQPAMGYGMHPAMRYGTHPHPGMHPVMGYGTHPHPGMHPVMGYGMHSHPGMHPAMGYGMHPHPGMHQEMGYGTHPHPGMHPSMGYGMHPSMIPQIPQTYVPSIEPTLSPSAAYVPIASPIPSQIEIIPSPVASPIETIPSPVVSPKIVPSVYVPNPINFPLLGTSPNLEPPPPSILRRQNTISGIILDELTRYQACRDYMNKAVKGLIYYTLPVSNIKTRLRIYSTGNNFRFADDGDIYFNWCTINPDGTNGDDYFHLSLHRPRPDENKEVGALHVKMDDTGITKRICVRINEDKHYEISIKEENALIDDLDHITDDMVQVLIRYYALRGEVATKVHTSNCK
jgi:hypothetical protein